MSAANGYSNPAIAGSGTIACGLAACASAAGDVRVLARSEASAWRAEEQAHKLAGKVDGGVPERIKVTLDEADLADCDLVVEAIAEEYESKAELLARLGQTCPEADLASTTSSLSVADLGERSGYAERFFGFHVFNPVTRMELVELCLPNDVREGIEQRARAWCRALGKTAVVVPDVRGFVVNRLLFPYLFDAVRLMEETGMPAEDVDACLKLGAGHPMGPLALLDLVGLDVAVAIGDSLHQDSGLPHQEPPALLRRLIDEGKLGRKSGAGLYDYG